MNGPLKNAERYFLNLSLIASLVLASFLFVDVGGTKDLNIISGWVNKLLMNGWLQGYPLLGSDYPPLFFATIYPFTHLDISQAQLKHLVNFSSVFFLVLASVSYFFYTRSRVLAILFFMALYLNVALFKYIDINSAVFFLLALLCLVNQRYFIFGLLFTLSCLVKWQPLIFSPFFLLYLWKINGRHWHLRNSPLLQAGLGCGLLLIPSLLLFGTAMLAALNSVLNEPYISGNALNMHWLTTYWLHLQQPELFGELQNGNNDWIRHDGILLSLLKLPFLISFLLALWLFARRQRSLDDLLAFSLVGYLLYFTLNTGVHENHLVFAVVLGFVMLARQVLAGASLLLLALMLNINMALFYAAQGALRNLGGFDLSMLLAGFFSAYLLLFCFRQLWQAR